MSMCACVCACVVMANISQEKGREWNEFVRRNGMGLGVWAMFMLCFLHKSHDDCVRTHFLS